MRTAVLPVGGNAPGPASTDSVANILERELDRTIHDWLGMVEKEPELNRVPLNYKERTGHLPNLSMT
jgi:hypothetical protein